MSRILAPNGKMDEMSAAMGLTSLESLDEFVSTNYRNYQRYQCQLERIPGVSLITYNKTERNNYQYIILEIDETKTLISRDQLALILWLENILVRRYFYPGCHRMEPYNSYYPHAGLVLPETEKLVQRVLCLPTGTSVNPADISQICQIIQFVVEHGREVRERLEKSEPWGRIPTEPTALDRGCQRDIQISDQPRATGLRHSPDPNAVGVSSGTIPKVLCSSKPCPLPSPIGPSPSFVG